jgi:nicotinamidase-related amidase
VSQRAVALIVVDMQTGLDDPQYGERCNPRCEANIQRLLSAWRNAAQPV